MNQPVHPTPDPPSALTLSPEDAAVVDALLDTRQPLADSPRAQRAKAWLNLLAAAPAPQAPPDLLQNTLARVQADRMTLTTPPRPLSTPEPAPSRSFAARYLREFAAMAIAASLLGVVVTLGISQARQSANRVACASNLMTLGDAFSTYAATNQNQLPALAMPADHNWLHPDPALADSHSNDANLLPLVTAGLVRPVNFLCPARTAPRAITPDDSSRGYSYVNLFAATPPHWDHTHATIVLADRNPLFDPAATLDPQSNSANHAGRGNYLVRADGSVTWETSPNVGPDHDNIWTLGPGPQYATTYTGTETPTSPADVFLCP